MGSQTVQSQDKSVYMMILIVHLIVKYALCSNDDDDDVQFYSSAWFH